MTIMWLLIGVLFVFAYIGIIMPLLPSVILVWAAFLVYQVSFDSQLGWVFWTAMVLLTVLLLISDFITNSHFVQKYGGSRLGGWTAIIGVVVGTFVFPPFGMIIIPFICVFLMEFIVYRDAKKALRASYGSLLGFLSGMAAKIIITTIMVVWFLIATK